MRHNKKINALGRTSAHRNAMLANMSVSLLKSDNKKKRIFTTLAKAKALRVFVEPIITKCKEDTTHSRRLVFQVLQDKATVTELFQNVSQKVADRPGGYTRIIKTGNRLGDNAAMCFIELVDYNEDMQKAAGKAEAKKTRRSRRGSGSAKATAEATSVEETKEKPKKAAAAKAPKAEVKVEETPTEVKEAPKKDEE